LLSEKLLEYGFDIATGWTDTHLLLVWVWKWRGGFMQDALDIAWIALNKNTIPWEPCSAFLPSGIRMWTPVMTQRWMKEWEIRILAEWIFRVSEEIKDFVYLDTKEERIALKKSFRIFIAESSELKSIREEVKELCQKFPIYS
jgi:glycine hydroxymethyltransferase